jgi:hypothetical protein
VKTLAISSNGDPLFVRDDLGHDFEVEAHWISDARFRNWADDGTTPWDATWDKISNEFVHESIRDVSVDWRKVRGYLSAEPMLVKPALRILTAHHLPHPEERAEQQRRARTVELLGGEVVDEIVLRREEAEDARWHQRHPKARPSHSSVWLPQSYQIVGSTPLFTNIKVQRMTVPFMEISLVATPAEKTETLEEVHARRAEAMRRLQDPPRTIEDDVRALIHGIHSRPVL